MNSKKIKYLVYMASVIVLIFAAFDSYVTIRIHDELGKMVSNPSRWPIGAYVYNKDIGFDFAPNVSGYIQDSSFYVKSHRLGYRIGEHEDAVSSQPGGIMSLGCSMTYGDEVNSEQTFTQLIADSLNIPAYNYGICSFSYIHALVKAQQLKDNGLLDELRPEYVILGCWRGLPIRSKSPFPPIAAKNIPLMGAYIAKDGGDLGIVYPLSSRHVFELATLYRKEGPGLSLRKFTKIFFAVPKFVYIYLKNSNLFKKMRDIKPNNRVSDYDVYDYCFTEIENLFSPYQSKIMVLHMPIAVSDRPSDDLRKAIAKHPGILFVDGFQALKKHDVPAGDYRGKHPQPAAHRAYALETISSIK